MSAASASIFLSTSQSETTSTGATWIRRNRSHLPYQPQPIRPTRGGFWPANGASAGDGRPGQAGGPGLEECSTIHAHLSRRGCDSGTTRPDYTSPRIGSREGALRKMGARSKPGACPFVLLWDAPRPCGRGAGRVNVREGRLRATLSERVSHDTAAGLDRVRDSRLPDLCARRRSADEQARDVAGRRLREDQGVRRLRPER